MDRLICRNFPVSDVAEATITVRPAEISVTGFGAFRAIVIEVDGRVGGWYGIPSRGVYSSAIFQSYGPLPALIVMEAAELYLACSREGFGRDLQTIAIGL